MSDEPTLRYTNTRLFDLRSQIPCSSQHTHFFLSLQFNGRIGNWISLFAPSLSCSVPLFLRLRSWRPDVECFVRITTALGVTLNDAVYFCRQHVTQYCHRGELATTTNFTLLNQTTLTINKKLLNFIIILNVKQLSSNK